MTILTISGSLRADSTNTRLLRACARLIGDAIQFEFAISPGEMPHFSPDADGDDPPSPVAAFRRQVGASDGVLICTPEYAFGVPGSLKNALDWMVSSGEFDRKPVGVISASPNQGGADRARQSLLLTLKALGANVAEGATIAIPLIGRKLDAAGAITDTDTEQQLTHLLDTFLHVVQSSV